MFYDKFKELCETKNVSVSKAATDIGLSNSTPTKWKNTGATPDSTTITKIAAYYGVSVGYLLGAEKEKTPTSEGERPILEGTYYRLARGAKELGLTDEDVDAILNLYTKHKERNK